MDCKSLELSCVSRVMVILQDSGCYLLFGSVEVGNIYHIHDKCCQSQTEYHYLIDFVMVTVSYKYLAPLKQTLLKMISCAGTEADPAGSSH